MTKGFFKRFIPDRHKIRSYKHLQIFGNMHLDPSLWRWQCNSVAMAFSIGLFTAFMPIPFQMIMAATLAIIFRANLPVAVALVWITNPVTLPPIVYFAYKAGTHLITTAPVQLASESSWWMLGIRFGHYWKPLLVGLFTCAIVSAILANISIRVIWWFTTYLSTKKNERLRTRK
ncbi:MAG: DUF2062 domain-containing protein [Gammaproteobacteria bacterium]